ncbi:MAG TPA: cellulase family glycosylhydrolase [Bacteroidota bacterium]|nr:cellulase family glycosylhydrolase [Bacteroidota bacterium]
MKNKAGRISLLLMLCCSFHFLAAQEPQAHKKFHDWWHDVNVGEASKDPDMKKLPLISVKENKFINPHGDTVLFRGLAIADPDKIEHEGHWSKDLFVKVKDMGAMLVRIPVHPVSWRERGPAQYLTLLDQAVEWCTELDMYVIIDWHSIGNLEMELFQDPMYNTTKRETYEFWRTIARHFSGNNTVAFYELFNEPTLYRGELGSMSWSEWKKINENMIKLIRAYDKETIPLVAGLDWAYDLTPLNIEPIDAEGIGYVTHPYPHKRTKPYEPKWEEDFGFAASRYPIIATEIGFTLGKEGMADNGEYGRAIVTYLEKRGISWTAWVFDPEWTPRMFESWDTYTLTESGEFFKKAMHGQIGN